MNPMNIKILLLSAAAAALAVSCTKDDDTGDILREEREAFAAQTEIGVYPKGESALTFDRDAHQLYLNPSAGVFRLQNDTGESYLKVTLTEAPQQGSVTGLTLNNNMGLTNLNADDAEVIRLSGGNCWIWSDSNHTGVIIPWID